MASVQRPTYTQAIPPAARRVTEGGQEYACWTDRLGQSVKALVLPGNRCRRTVPRKWVGLYRDARGKQQKTKVFGDRSLAMDTAIKLERHAQAVREGRASASSSADPSRVHLIDFIADYTTYLEAKGSSPEHAARVESSLRELIRRHGLTTPGSVDPEALAATLERDRKAGDPRGRKRGGKPLSIRWRNKRTGELRSYGRWLARHRKLPDPFASLPMANAETDRRRTRRPLPAAEFEKLLAATRSSTETIHGIVPGDRWALYLLAAYTGLRAGALARLTPEAFTWGNGIPTAVHSAARLQKNKSAHGIPLASAVGGHLTDWLRSRPAGIPLWGRNRRWADRAAELIRVDLAAAEIPFEDAAGEVFDFHALRGQFAFLLATNGVPLVAAQQLLDHSSPILTANIYSRFGGELASEVEKLPALGAGLGAIGAGSSPKVPPTGKKKTARGKPKTKGKRNKS